MPPPRPTSRLLDATLLAGAATVGYAYVGYPLLIGLAARRRRRPGRDTAAHLAAATPMAALPSVSVIVAALDESSVIAAKVADCLAQDLDGTVPEVIVVADGSTDDTPARAEAAGATVLFAPERRGKSHAINRGVAAATGEVVILTDANCFAEPGSFRRIATAFTDPTVGLVSGAKTVGGDGARGSGEGAYWRFESFVKSAESAFGCVMGAPGELCGVRRATFRPIPAGVVNDDYHLTCDALAQGLRTTYEPLARTHEEVSGTIAEEVERRTRVAAGTWQTTLAHLGLCNPRRGWTATAFVSHRVVRSLVVPPLLVLLWLAAVLGWRRSLLARLTASASSLLGGLALLGFGSDHKAFAVPFQFVLMNATTLRGASRHLTGRQPVTWRKADRSLRP